MPADPKPPAVWTIEALERERQTRLKEAVAGEPSKTGKAERRDALAAEIKKFQNPEDPDAPPTCKSYEAAEALIIKAMKKGAKMAEVRLDLTHQRLTVVPADVLRLGESLVQLSVVGNSILELPADLDLCKRLRVLNLAANELAGLPKLTTMRDLIHVGLGYNKITDAGLPMLSRCLPSSLQSLDLTANELIDLEGLLELFDEKFHSLRHLSLKSNPLAIRGDYRSTVAKSSFGAHVNLLDGGDLSAADTAPAAVPEAASGGGEGAELEGEDEEAAAEVVDDGKPKITLKVTVMQLSGVPEVAASAPATDEAAPAPATGEGEGEAEQLVVEFTLLGKKTCTRPMTRAPVVDFESTSVELIVPRSVELRDELIVHGIPFDVYTLSPPAAAPEGEEEQAGEAEPERSLLGTVSTHWGSLASGEAELTQVSSAFVQPPAPKTKSKKPAKLPPPFKLSVTASIQILA